MKKKFIAPLLAGFAAIGTAHAQSSVTIYGIVDYGVEYVTNNGGGSMLGGVSGVKQGSRLGFKGVEDLGAGSSAVFLLENGFNVGTGAAQQGGLLFGRQAWVGLANTGYGTVTMGRQYDSVVSNVAFLLTSPVIGGGNTAHVGDLDNLNNTKRVSNSVKYRTPSLNGITADVVYGFGESAGSMGRNQIWSTGLRYDGGPLQIGAAYLNARNPNQSFFASAPTLTTGTTNNMTSSPVYSGYASAKSYQTIAAIVDYTIGKTTIGLNYTNVQFKALGDTNSGPNPLGLRGTANFNTAELNLKYVVSPATVLGAVYNWTHGTGVGAVGKSDYHMLSLVWDYFLSKRTDVYVLGSYQMASGQDSTGKAAVATVLTLSPSSTNRQAFIMAGVRHTF
ncbi:porin [Herbaspirillum sp. alder98]|uniref:porin n=1 Tax=Herbaspirillum sp. alder98 TaxID=2913096 RepID=UPI001CD8ACD0|nr:porin [Herbaspirillum sp. alder98]MCA1325359.1 porin [Herbaspirillum sp. alder98]